MDILSHYLLWHAPSNSNSSFHLLGGMSIPAEHFPQKSLSGNSRIGFSLLLTARPYPLLPLTHDPSFLYWLGITWWCLNLVHAWLPCVSMACLLFMHFPWPESSSAHSATHLWPLVVWMSLWAFILYVLLLSWAGSCLIVGLSFSNPFLTFFCGSINTSAMPS